MRRVLVIEGDAQALAALRQQARAAGLEVVETTPIAGGAGAVVPLVVALAPLLPTLIQTVNQIVSVSANHPDTPDVIKRQFQAAMSHLDASATAVAAAVLPNAPASG